MTSTHLSARKLGTELLKEIEELSGENLMACYQCGTCSAGCPLAFAMEALPHQIVRLLQLGQVDHVMACNSFWLCAACLTCASRCPKGVDLARVMEALRTIVIRAGKAPMQAFPPPVELMTEVPQLGTVGALRKLSG